MTEPIDVKELVWLACAIDCEGHILSTHRGLGFGITSKEFADKFDSILTRLGVRFVRRSSQYSPLKCSHAFTISAVGACKLLPLIIPHLTIKQVLAAETYVHCAKILANRKNSVADYRILLELLKREELAPGEVAKITGWSYHKAYGRMQLLERWGYITYKLKDNSRVWYAITDCVLPDSMHVLKNIKTSEVRVYEKEVGRE